MNKEIKRKYLGNSKKPKSWYNKKSIEDREMGNKNEIIISDFIKKWFTKNSFKRDNTGWGVIDYVDDLGKMVIELKSRRIKKNTFPTIIIGKNKYNEVLRYMKKGYKGYFLFKFTDRLSIYEVPQKLQKDVYFKQGGTNKRGYNEYSECMYIPIKYLRDCYNYNSYEEYIENK
jgi:hypothetical protein